MAEGQVNDTETKIAVMSQQIDQMYLSLGRLYDAIMGNGKPGLAADVQVMKAHIGYNQSRTIHERMSTVELAVIEIKEQLKADKEDRLKQEEKKEATLRGLLLPIVSDLIKIGGGALLYLILNSFFNH